MSEFLDLPWPTVAPPEPSPSDSFQQGERLNLPLAQTLREGFLEQNWDDESAARTHTVDQSGTFKINGGSAQLVVRAFLPPLSLPRFPPLRERFNVMQKWEGFVIEVKDDTFIARLVPIVGDGPDQEAEIYLSEIEADDQSLIEPGAVFYWSIGYLDRPSGRWRVSTIRFRRLPKWTDKDLETARAKAIRLKNLLDGT